MLRLVSAHPARCLRAAHRGAQYGARRARAGEGHGTRGRARRGGWGWCGGPKCRGIVVSRAAGTPGVQRAHELCALARSPRPVSAASEREQRECSLGGWGDGGIGVQVGLWCMRRLDREASAEYLHESKSTACKRRNGSRVRSLKCRTVYISQCGQEISSGC